jgi:hypothetical protein
VLVSRDVIPILSHTRVIFQVGLIYIVLIHFVRRVAMGFLTTDFVTVTSRARLGQADNSALGKETLTHHLPLGVAVTPGSHFEAV